MRILYLIHQFYPECFTGTEKIFLNVVTMAQKYGHRVKVMTYSSYEDSSYDQRWVTFYLDISFIRGSRWLL